MGYVTQERWFTHHQQYLDYLKTWDMKKLKYLSSRKIGESFNSEVLMTVGGWNEGPQGGDFWSEKYDNALADESFLREIKRNIQIIETGIDPALIEDTGTGLPDYLYQRDTDV